MSAEPLPLDVAIEWTRRLAAAHRGAGGWPPVQLCDEIDRLRAEIDRLRGMEQRAREEAITGETTSRHAEGWRAAARYILRGEAS